MSPPDSDAGVPRCAYSRAELEQLMAVQRNALRLHCYRLLGSAHDSDDMVQETFVRALRSLHTLSEPGAARGWLYRIATNVCLDELRKRPTRRARGTELGEAGDPDQTPPAATREEAWLEPVPSSWLLPESATARDPAAQYALKESIALAFVAALQVLTPAQRAVLLLRDVVGLSAEETAAALRCSVSSANSTLQRARAALEERVGARGARPSEQAEAVDRALVERYMRAWESGDLDAIIALLHTEVSLAMPPIPLWISGRAAVARFFAHRVRKAMEAHRFRTVLIEVSGTLGVGFYRLGDDGQAHFFGLQVLEVRDGHVAVIDHFMSKLAHAAFFAEGLAMTIPL